MSRRRAAFKWLDRRLGRAWNRFWGGVIGLGGLGAVWTSLSAGVDELDETWPFLLVGALFLLFAVKLFRSRAPLGDSLDESPRR
ncbi:MAG TPA: hypothetical protein VLA37_12060 [Sphingomonadaceae bacterium]|nr:hypothetical protein [Sphingomonadaceae bacterium]